MFSLRMESPSTCCRMIETEKIHDSQPNTVKKISHSHSCTASIHIAANAHLHLWYRRIQSTLPCTLWWLTVECWLVLLLFVHLFVCAHSLIHSRHAFVCVWWRRRWRRWRWRLSVACNAIADVTHIHACTRTHRQSERALSYRCLRATGYCIVLCNRVLLLLSISFVFFMWICLRYGTIRTSHV